MVQCFYDKRCLLAVRTSILVVTPCTKCLHAHAHTHTHIHIHTHTHTRARTRMEVANVHTSHLGSARTYGDVFARAVSRNNLAADELFFPFCSGRQRCQLVCSRLAGSLCSVATILYCQIAGSVGSGEDNHSQRCNARYSRPCSEWCHSRV